MQTYFRLLRYIAPHKKKFFLGLVLAFFASIFNGVSLTAMKPIFDVMGSGSEKPFQLQFSPNDLRLLHAEDETNRLRLLLPKAAIHKDAEAELNTIVKEPRPELGMIDGISSLKSKAVLYINEKSIQLTALQILIYVCIATVPIYLLKLFSIIGTVYFMAQTGLAAIRDVRRHLYEKLQNLPMSYFVREKTGILMSRIINDVTLVSDALSNDLRVSMINFFIIVTHLTLLTMISYKLVLLCLVGVPLLLWPVNYLAKRIKSITGDEQTRLAELNGHLQEVISGIRVIRAFGMEGYELGRFDNINNDLYEKNFKYRVAHIIGPALVEFTTSFIIVGLLLYGGFQVVEGQFSSGTFFLFLFTLIVILSPIKQMASWYNMLNRTVAAGERVFDIMDRSAEVEDPIHPVEPKRLEDKIEFKKINFIYPESEDKVLKNIGIKAQIGQTIAFVGHSGAGKSTLVDLIPRFYDPTEGSILFDGVDTRAMRIKDLRDKIGVVTQEIFLFNGSIRENIAYGRDDISAKEIEKAAKLAFADEFIRKLPMGYETQIGERGLMLSGGQRQRISIARALLKDPEILILDEATSALDTQSERLVQKALDKLMQNRTTFVIAHRLSTIYKADQIIVLQNGRIVERGTHKALLRKSGVYRKLYNMQFQDH